MVNIAICDDDSNVIACIDDYVNEIIEEFGIQANTNKFSSSSELLASFKNKIFNLIILDIVMPEKNGIETAKELRRSGFEGDIIFMTSNTEYALDAYDVYPLTFLPKPVSKEKLSDVMKKFFAKNSYSTTMVIRNNDGAKEAVAVDSILYVESRGHSVCYALETGEVYTVTGNFTKTVTSLPEYFFRCHRCYAVNMKKTKTIQRYFFVLENDVQIPISKGEFKEAQKRFVYSS